MRIEKARPEHLPALAAMERECFPADPWPEELIARLLPSFTVAEEDGVLAGYIVVSAVLDEGNIDNVAAAPAFRRRGVGSALVADAIRRAEEDGLAALHLEVRASNEPALRLYEKHGFTVDGRRRNYYTKPREDAVLMTKVLKTC